MPESLFPPLPPLRLEISFTPPEEFFRFIPSPLGLWGTPEQQRTVYALRCGFADQARATYDRGDAAGADALMRLAEEITLDTIQFMAERDRHVNPFYRDERIPGFVAAHYTGGQGEVHNSGSRFEPSALSQVELGSDLATRLGLR